MVENVIQEHLLGYVLRKLSIRVRFRDFSYPAIRPWIFAKITKNLKKFQDFWKIRGCPSSATEIRKIKTYFFARTIVFSNVCELVLALERVCAGLQPRGPHFWDIRKS